MHWRILPVRKLNLRCWENEWVVSDAVSGDTHLLNFAAGVIMNRLLAGPASAVELAAELMRTGEKEDGIVQDYLEALAATYLIEPASV